MSTITALKRIAQGGLGSAANILLSLIRAKFSALFVGKAGMAIVGQLSGWMMQANFIYTLGLQIGFVVRIAESRVSGNKAEEERLRMTFLQAVLVITTLLAIFCLAFPGPINEWLFRGLDYTRYVRLSGIAIFFAGLSSVYTTYLSGYKRFTDAVWLSFITSVLNVGLTIYMMWQHGLEGVAFSLPITTMVNLAGAAYFCHKAQIPLGLNKVLRFDLFSRQLFWALLQTGIVSMLTSLSSQMAQTEIRGYAQLVCGLEEAGLLQSVLNLNQQYLGMIQATAQTYFVPHLAECRTDEELEREINKLMRVLALVTLPSLALMASLSDQIMVIIYSRDFASAGHLLTLSSIGIFLVFQTFLMGTSMYIRRRLVFWLCSELVAQGIYVLLVHSFVAPMGIAAVSYSYIAYHGLRFCVSMLYLRLRHGFRLRPQVALLQSLSIGLLVLINYLHGMLAWPLLVLVALGGSALIILPTVHADEWAKLRKLVASRLPGGRSR